MSQPPALSYATPTHLRRHLGRTIYLLLQLAWSAVLTCMAWVRGVGIHDEFYPFVTPMILLGLTACLLSAISLYPPIGRFTYWLALLATACLPIPALYASARWPGGDDGGGFGWIFLVLGPSFLSVPLAFAGLIVGAVTAALKPDPPPSSSPTR